MVDVDHANNSVHRVYVYDHVYQTFPKELKYNHLSSVYDK